jgi:hypothetical protein
MDDKNEILKSSACPLLKLTCEWHNLSREKLSAFIKKNRYLIRNDRISIKIHRMPIINL